MSAGTEAATDSVVWSSRLGAHLEASRKRAKLRRVDLANQLHVSEETIRLWERGSVQPSAANLARLIAVVALETVDWPLRTEHAPELPPLAAQLWKERNDRGITQAAAAQILGVSQATYAGWETGRSTPAESLVDAVAEFLGGSSNEARALCSASFIVDTTDWPPFGQLVGARRQALRVTRGELAKAVGVSQQTVVAWELGSRMPSAKRLPLLARVLAVSTESLAAELPQGPVTTALGKLIRGRQRELGLRSADVALLTGTTEATVSRWVHGQSRPGPKNLQRLAQTLNMSYASVSQAVGGSA